jgi:crossover junction endodeoxyribonuclease RuvC
MIIGAIDPGAKGALAFIDTSDLTLVVWDTPTFKIKSGRTVKTKIDSVNFAEMIRTAAPDVMYVERVGAMPGQGVTSMFNFGFAAGILEGLCAMAGIRMEYRRPQEWQQTARVPRGKDGSRARASQLFPKHAMLFSRVKDDGRSDAVCLAYSGVLEHHEL